jgi:hypothetical protein
MLNAAIRDIPVPKRLMHRPLTDKGFPVPWFASFIDGAWNLVAVDPRKIPYAIRKKICWVCGEPLGKYLCFVIGPMCSINRISAEPPSHRECAEYAVRACPFLSRPRMRRNEAESEAIGGTSETVPGIMIEHNPGANLIWITKSYRLVPDGNGRALIEIGPPVETLWYAEGRIATRAEILAAFDKGLSLLRPMAAAEEGGTKELEQHLAEAMKLVPA